MKIIKNTLREIKYFFKNLYKFITKVIDYAPILWEDEDWDWEYILILLKHKLKRTRQTIVKNDIIKAVTRVEKQIKYAEYLINIILEGNSLKEEWDKIEEKYGKYTLEKEDEDGNKMCHLTRTKITKENEEEYNKEFRILCKKTQIKQQEIWNRLFKHMNLYMKSWWD